MTHSHTRTTDATMTLIQRALRWWKEWGATLLSILALVVSGGIWIAGQSGFVLIGPRDALGQAVTGLNARLTNDSTYFADALDSTQAEQARVRGEVEDAKREMAYVLRAIEAGNRVTCFRDRPAAEVSGIVCPSGSVPR
jgi:hypothetical protein